jgi:beta-N-acetylhexosaminidase
MPAKPGVALSQNKGDRPLPLAAVFSVEGAALNDAERSLFSAAQPFGFILFGRNCENPIQLRALTEDLRACVGWDCPILVDQEGGRVARLKPPHWDAWAPALDYGKGISANPETGKMRLYRDMKTMAETLLKSGIDVNCAPVVDVLRPETHDVIGDRAYSENPEIVAEAGDAVCQAFLETGVVPIIKHLPGHGRALCDSHLDLPVVGASLAELSESDFIPFASLCRRPYAKSLWGMVAHVIYTAIDPERPATLSETVIRDVIRGRIGFDGLLFSDDLDMKALDKFGPVDQRARESLQAGCDLALYCWAKLDVMEKLAATLPPLSAAGWARWQASLEARWAA